MADRAVISVPLKPETRERLSRLAAAQQRSSALLAAEAIEDYLTLQEWQLAEIAAATAELDRGEGVSQDEVEVWAASLPGGGATKPRA